MKRTIAIILLVSALATGLLAACQPAVPENDIVIQSNSERLIKAAQAAAQASSVEENAAAQHPGEQPAITPQSRLREQYGIPEQYQATLQGTQSNLSVRVDASISLPEAEKLPVAKVRAGDFTQKQVDDFLKAVFGGAGMYVQPQDYTKARYQRMIDREKARLDTISPGDEMIRNAITQSIADYETHLANKPDSIQPVPSDGKIDGLFLQVNSSPDGSGKSVTVQLNKSFPADAEVELRVVEGEGIYTDDPIESKGVISYTRDEYAHQDVPQVITGGSVVEEVTALSLSGGSVQGSLLSTSPAEARAAAESFLQAANITGMAVESVKLISSYMDPGTLSFAVQMGRYASVEEYYQLNKETQAYEIRFARRLNGANINADMFYWSSRTENSLKAKEWYYENLLLHVDDDGVALFEWVAPLQIREVSAENAALLPFSDIQEIFEEMMLNIYEPHEINKTQTACYRITEIKLCLQRIADKGSYTTGIVAPVWMFYGYYSMEGDELAYAAPFTFPHLVVNAVDGTIIDLQAAY